MAHKSSMDSTAASSMHVDAMTSDVLAPSPWKIFGCQMVGIILLYYIQKKKQSLHIASDRNHRCLSYAFPQACGYLKKRRTKVRMGRCVLIISVVSEFPDFK